MSNCVLKFVSFKFESNKQYKPVTIELKSSWKNAKSFAHSIQYLWKDFFEWNSNNPLTGTGRFNFGMKNQTSHCQRCETVVDFNEIKYIIFLNWNSLNVSIYMCKVLTKDKAKLIITKEKTSSKTKEKKKMGKYWYVRMLTCRVICLIKSIVVVFIFLYFCCCLWEVRRSFILYRLVSHTLMLYTVD